MFQNSNRSELRSQGLKLRAEVFEMRRKLRGWRSNISHADEKFMKVVRGKRAQDSYSYWDNQLDDVFQELQVARDEYGLLEEQYDLAEANLDRVEYELAKLDQILESQPSSTAGRHSEVDYGFNLEIIASHSEKDDNHDVMPLSSLGDDDPLYDEYLSRLGDADICKETHLRLRSKYKRLLESKELRLQFGLELMAEDQGFLDMFDDEEANILEELDQVEEDVKRLKTNWSHKQDVHDEDSERAESEQWLGKLEDSTQSQYQRFPLLLQKPEDQEEELRSLLAEFDGTGNRITRWLMHKLRSSCSEVELLFRVSGEENGLFSDEENWQHDVMTFWYTDLSSIQFSGYENIYAVEATTVLSPLALPDQIQRPILKSLEDQDKDPHSQKVDNAVLFELRSHSETKNEKKREVEIERFIKDSKSARITEQIELQTNESC